jgi:tRNA nucleotidyltransferase (CCA-adding enzyme)
MSGARWEHFEHDADLGVRGVGTEMAQAFVQGAIALTAVVTDPARVKATTKIEIACEAADDELLFADWLNAVIYAMSTRKMLFSRYEVEVHDHRLRGAAWGEPIDIARHEPAVEVKGATYTALKVAKTGNSEWVAQCVVDV